MNIKCPICGKTIGWNKTNQFRPFCSQKCQQMDLSKWLNDLIKKK
ncbi:MAG: DNA gyrase inhibitor YacG [Candidatus Dasytiphilus stammeri]